MAKFWLYLSIIVRRIVADGRLVHFAGFGARSLPGEPPDADTEFRIASMPKSFTASAALLLWNAGLLALDDLAEDWQRDLSLSGLGNCWLLGLVVAAPVSALGQGRADVGGDLRAGVPGVAVGGWVDAANGEG